MPAYDFSIHPEAEREYDTLLAASTAVAHDLGNHLRLLNALVDEGLPPDVRPVTQRDGCSVYVFYGSSVQMVLATFGPTLLAALFVEIGTEHELSEAINTAANRAVTFFQI